MSADNSLYADVQEQPLAKFLRVTMALGGQRTHELRDEAKAEYEGLLHALKRAEMGVSRQVELHQHWRERALAAEQALGLYCEGHPLPPRAKA